MNMSSDVLSPEWWRSDPQADFAALRAHEGLWRDDKSQLWMVARHADLLEVERDAERFSSREPGRGGSYRLVPSEGEQTMISHDDPQHLTQRRMINRRFTPRAVRAHAEHYEAMITELIDGAEAEQSERSSVEIVDAIAGQLPARVTGELIGFGAERWREVKSWSERQMRIDRRYEEAEVLTDLENSINEWAVVMQEELPKRFAEPLDDLFSDWVKAELDPTAMVMETGLMIAGGAETTRTVIAHGLHLFTQHPDQWEYLAADPDRVPAAVEEMIRYVTPLNNMFRRATCDTTVAGTEIAEGDRLCLTYPAANRDESIFERPNDFDVTRDPNPHLSFGYGTHFCLGANLARIELRLLFEQLTARWTNLRVVSEPDIEPNIFARAVRSFDLTFDLR